MRLSRHSLQWAALLCAVAVAAFAGIMEGMMQPSDVVDVPGNDGVPEIPMPLRFPDAGWDLLRHPGTAAPVQDLGPLGRRFRLAGTFFAYADLAEADESRRAILDDLSGGRQHLVREGDRIGDVAIVRIEREQIVLRDDRGEERLYLSFAESATRPDRSSADVEGTVAEAPVPRRFEDMPTLEENRFGRRIADDRWIVSRDALLEYAGEMQEDPERFMSLLMAMQPDLDEADEIQGFVLDMLGENELYEAVGFRNGDIVRMVNSMPMTSPARAEYFISEFFRGTISALVFDIERDGQEQKLIHLLR